jgi:phage gpG-like protein
MSFSIEGKFKLSPDIETFLNNHKDIAPDAIEKGMYYISVEAPKEVKRTISSLGLTRSGKLQKGINAEVVKREKAIVGATTFYAPILEAGSKPHTINRDKKKRKKALFWPSAGHPVFQAKHPGTKKYQFLEGTIDDMDLESVFSRGIREVIGKFGG